MSTDFESAYTNISKSDLNSSVVNLADGVKWCETNLKLVLKLISLLLDNNYVEICDGFYRLGGQLAMGCASSGEALDTVAIWSELSKLEAVRGKDIKVTVGDKFDVLIESSESRFSVWEFNDIEKSTIKLQKRFRDDGLNIVETCDVDVLSSVVKQLGNIYPSHLGNNATLTHLYASHLDCSFIRKLGGGDPMVFVRRNLKYPVTVIPPESNTYNNYRFAVVSSELLRYRRICKNSKLIRMNEDLLKAELVAGGYSIRKIGKIFRMVIKRIEARYDSGLWTRIGENSTDEISTLYSSMEYDGHGDICVLKQLLQPSESDVLNWKFCYKNGPKVKSFVINRRKDLKKMQDFVKTCSKN